MSLLLTLLLTSCTEAGSKYYVDGDSGDEDAVGKEKVETLQGEKTRDEETIEAMKFFEKAKQQAKTNLEKVFVELHRIDAKKIRNMKAMMSFGGFGDNKQPENPSGLFGLMPGLEQSIQNNVSQTIISTIATKINNIEGRSSNLVTVLALAWLGRKDFTEGRDSLNTLLKDIQADNELKNESKGFVEELIKIFSKAAENTYSQLAEDKHPARASAMKVKISQENFSGGIALLEKLADVANADKSNLEKLKKLLVLN